jgi:uncharacterized protein (TIGR00251 family)
VAALKLRIVPNARHSEVVGEYGDAVKVKVAAPAVDGKANAALLEFLAEKLGVPEGLYPSSAARSRATSYWRFRDWKSRKQRDAVACFRTT